MSKLKYLRWRSSLGLVAINAIKLQCVRAAYVSASVLVYYVIRSFVDRDTRRFFEGKLLWGFTDTTDQTTRRLMILCSATSLLDLAGLPCNRLGTLASDSAGRYGIRIDQKM